MRQTSIEHEGFFARLRAKAKAFFKSVALTEITRGIRLAPSGKYAKQRRNARVWTPNKETRTRHITPPVHPVFPSTRDNTVHAYTYGRKDAKTVARMSWKDRRELARKIEMRARDIEKQGKK